MMPPLRLSLDQLDPALLAGGRIGVEKESLRVGSDGRISQRDHPTDLGSALTHPYITTDYAEALIEFVTPVCSTASEVRSFLQGLHQFTYQRLNEETLWATSMPCMVGSEQSIRIAEYGHSNIGMMKHIYRRGLGYRYGRIMQTIAGIHFNYSLADDLVARLTADHAPHHAGDAPADALYLGMIRNFQRLGWLICYLFGASPAVCTSFLHGREHPFDQFDYGTVYLPHATSLRMSDIGYKNKNQTALAIDYNSLDGYIRTLRRAIQTPAPEYEKIGIKVDGQYRQLNANLLQIENEYYSFVRPKQPTRSGEKPTNALSQRGVQYVEMRALDLCVFDPVGVSESRLRFLQTFLLYCAMLESPPFSTAELEQINANQALVATHGRQPGLELQRGEGAIRLQDWAREVAKALEQVAERMDEAAPGATGFAQAVREQRPAIENPELTPSARILAEMRDREETFFALARRYSEAHRETLLAAPQDGAIKTLLEQCTWDSLQAQQDLEDRDTLSFDEFLAAYFEDRLPLG
ncbi:MAG: glutamate--cysteine ligase [Pseudomonadota bacterium]|nr:glutamate--cysteine ligase [Pseudomonadota bacterium]